MNTQAFICMRAFPFSYNKNNYIQGFCMRILIGGEPHKTHNYVNALTALNVSADSCYYDLLGSYDGLILPGGGDIDPYFFHETNHGSLNIDKRADYAQFKLLEHFIAQGKPILGICKGMQIINVYFGGSIIQDLPTAVLHRHKEKDQFHMVYNKKNTILHDLYGKAMITNSAHHQGVGRLGKHMEAIALTKDNVVEAIIHTSLPILGVQWHPERMPENGRNLYMGNGKRLLKAFFKI